MSDQVYTSADGADGALLAEEPPTTLTEEVLAGGEVVEAREPNNIIARLGAEFFGTFLLVFVGVGAALYSSILGFGQLGVALAFGIALIGGIAAVGNVSGGHFNPAVTLGLTLAGRSSWRDLVPYWVSQVAGGAFAGLVLWSITPREVNVVHELSSTSRAELFQSAANGYASHSPAFDGTAAAKVQEYLDLGATTDQIKSAIEQGQLQAFEPSTNFTWANALIMETIVVALFVAVILAVTDVRSKLKFQPVVIGLTLAVLLAVAMPVTNGSLNPARSLSAAIFGGAWTWGQLWVFVVGPFLGAAIAALFYRGFAVPESFGTAGIEQVGPGAQAALGGEPWQATPVLVVDDAAADTLPRGVNVVDDAVEPIADPAALAAEAEAEALALQADAEVLVAEADAEDALTADLVADESPEADLTDETTIAPAPADADVVVEEEVVVVEADDEDDEPEGDTVLRP